MFDELVDFETMLHRNPPSGWGIQHRGGSVERMTSFGALGGICLETTVPPANQMGSPVSHRFFGKSSTSWSGPTAPAVRQNQKRKTERSVRRTIHEKEEHKRGEVQGIEDEKFSIIEKSPEGSSPSPRVEIQIQHTDKCTSKCSDSPRMSSSAAKEKHEAKNAPMCTEQLSMLPRTELRLDTKATKGGHSPMS
ncbi:hypothetical protein DFH09DRAFT_1108107 [Mycena vulgaris]|nr:hypothetical protein DFH09DRAFT_1108107 [Mycena vulgaris]